MFHENKFVTDFKEKAKLFNSHFATQCSLISNSSKLPSHIAKVIQNLEPNKAHGDNNISTHMLKVCRPSIYKPLEIIFNQFLETGVFPCEWKKGHIVPIHKKGGQTDIEKLPSSVAATYLWENSWKINV